MGLRCTPRCEQKSMLLSVHCACSNNLSRDVYSHGPLKCPTRIGRNNSIQILHPAFPAPDKRV
jgi:hypothetical protein